MNPFTEFNAFFAAATTAAICVTDGFDGSALTSAVSVATDELMALVSLGKSLFAELTAAAA